MVVMVDDLRDHLSGLGEVLQFVPLELFSDGTVETLNEGVVRRRVRADQGMPHARFAQRPGKLGGDEGRSMIALDRRTHVLGQGLDGGGLNDTRGFFASTPN